MVTLQAIIFISDFAIIMDGGGVVCYLTEYFLLYLQTW